MKKVIYALFIVVMICALVGCGSQSNEGDNNQKSGQNGGANNQEQEPEYNITYEVEGIFFESFGERYVKTKFGPVNFNELLRNLCKHRLLCVDKLKEGGKLEIDLSEICSNIYINNELTDTNGRINYTMQDFDINIKVELDKSKLGYVIKIEGNDTIYFYQAYSSSGSIILDFQYTSETVEDSVAFMDDIMEYKDIVYDTQGRLYSYSWTRYNPGGSGALYSYNLLSQVKQGNDYYIAYFLDYDEKGNLIKIYDPGTEQEYEEFDYEQQKYVTKTRIVGDHLYYTFEYDGNVRTKCFRSDYEYYGQYSYSENGLISSIALHDSRDDHLFKYDYGVEEVYVFEYYNFGKYYELGHFDPWTVGMN